MEMRWEGMALASQPQNIRVENLSLGEYREYYTQHSVSSRLSVFVQYEFIKYYQMLSSRDVLIYKIQAASGEVSFYIFDKVKQKDDQFSLTSTSFSPYAGLILPPKDAGQVVTTYVTLIEHIKRENSQKLDLTIEIRLPPPQFDSRVEIDQWALWSLGFTQNVGYLGRYLKPNNTELNRNRKRRLKDLQVISEDWKIETSNVVDYDTYDLMMKNRMSRHGVNLTHSFADFNFLETLLDGNFITCWKLIHNDHLCSAAIVFCDTDCNILQYLGQSDCGYNLGTQDLILSQIIEWSSVQKKNLLLGTSTRPENNHREINFGLDRYKHSWGASVYTCYRYTFETPRNVKLI
jgi:hypothetical protein